MTFELMHILRSVALAIFPIFPGSMIFLGSIFGVLTGRGHELLSSRMDIAIYWGIVGSIMYLEVSLYPIFFGEEI